MLSAENEFIIFCRSIHNHKNIDWAFLNSKLTSAYNEIVYKKRKGNISEAIDVVTRLSIIVDAIEKNGLDHKLDAYDKVCSNLKELSEACFNHAVSEFKTDNYKSAFYIFEKLSLSKFMSVDAAIGIFFCCKILGISQDNWAFYGFSSASSKSIDIIMAYAEKIKDAGRVSEAINVLMFSICLYPSDYRSYMKISMYQKQENHKSIRILNNSRRSCLIDSNNIEAVTEYLQNCLFIYSDEYQDSYKFISKIESLVLNVDSRVLWARYFYINGNFLSSKSMLESYISGNTSGYYLDYAITMLGYCKLALGEYGEGFLLIESRRTKKTFSIKTKYPDGSVANVNCNLIGVKDVNVDNFCDAVTIIYEGGIGDTIISLCHLGEVANFFGKINLVVQKRLEKICSISFSSEKISVFGEDRLSDFVEKNHKIMLAGSLPGLSFYQKNCISTSGVCLKVDELSIIEWEKRLSHLNKIRIGIFWPVEEEGKKERTYRNPETTLFSDIKYINKNISLINLNIKKIDRLNEVYINDFSEHQTDMLQTAALIKNLDFVVCIDSGPAVVSAALGVDTIIIANVNALWHLNQNADGYSEWFSTAKVFKCRKLSQWSDIKQDVYLYIKQKIEKLLNNISY